MLNQSTPSTDDAERSNGRLIAAGRLAWLLLTALLLALFIAGIPARFAELSQVCAAASCPPLTLAPSEAAVLVARGGSLGLYAGYHVAIETGLVAVMLPLALLIFWRRFQEPIGALVSFALVLFSLNFMVEADSSALALLPALAPLHAILTSLAAVPFMLLFFLFPDGRFTPRWTRGLAAILVAGALVDTLLWTKVGSTPSGQFSFAFLYLLLGCLLPGVGAQVYRYQVVSTAVERQQTKWVIAGLAGMLVPILGWSAFVELWPLALGLPRLLFNTAAYGVMALFILPFPLALALAILRYRLWDIDILVRRTLTYSLLSGVLALVYFGSVVLLQVVVTAVGGRQTALITVLSTLLIAALFQPLRRRVQAAIDRRFYRRQVDAARTLARFAETARDEVALPALTAELQAVVQETLQPEHVSVWLKRP